MAKHGIKVNFREQSYGGVLVTPVVERYAEMFCTVVAANGGPSLITQRRDGYSAYVQSVEGLEESLSPRQLREVSTGWGVTVIMDPWEVGHFYGYDAHTVAENGMSLKGMNF